MIDKNYLFSSTCNRWIKPIYTNKELISILEANDLSESFNRLEGTELSYDEKVIVELIKEGKLSEIQWINLALLYLRW